MPQSINSVIQTLVMGLSQTLLLAGINAFGYIAPVSTSQVLMQPDAVRSFFSWCFAGLPMIGYGVCAAIMVLYNLEPQTQPAKEGASPQTNSRS